MSTEQKAIQESLEHWERMIEWVKKQPKDDINKTKIKKELGEYWLGKNCSLCQNYRRDKSCANCPLSKKYGNDDIFTTICTETYGKITFSTTWQEWLEHAEVMVEQLKSLVEFQVGDRVKQLRNDQWFGVMTITNISHYPSIFCQHPKHGEGSFEYGDLIKIGGSMSRYDEIKQEIEGVTGWDKKVDDLMQEIYKNKNLSDYYHLSIPFNLNSCIYITKWNGNEDWKEIETFIYSSQHEKFEVFKKALLWLLDHSDIKNEKAEKRKELQRQLDDVKKQQEDIQRQIDDYK